MSELIQYKRAVVVSDLICTLNNVHKENISPALVSIISGSCLKCLTLVFCPRYAVLKTTSMLIALQKLIMVIITSC